MNGITVRLCVHSVCDTQTLYLELGSISRMSHYACANILKLNKLQILKCQATWRQDAQLVQGWWQLRAASGTLRSSAIGAYLGGLPSSPEVVQAIGALELMKATVFKTQQYKV